MADEAQGTATTQAVTLDTNQSSRGAIHSVFNAVIDGIDVPESVKSKSADAEAPKFDTEGSEEGGEEETPGEPVGESEAAGGSEESTDEAAEEEVSDEPEAKASTDQKKPIKMRVGEKAFNHSPDALVAVVIDGKETEVPIAKVIQEYSGKYVVDRELNKVRVQEKEVKETKQKVDELHAGYQQVGELVEKAFEGIRDGKGLESYHDLVMLSGKYENPVDWEADLIRMIVPLFGQLQEMDEGQQNAWLNERKLRYYDTQKKAAKEAAEKQGPKSQLEKEVKQVRESLSISNEEWTFAVELLDEARKAGKLGEFGIQQVTPQVAAGIVLQARATDKVDKRLPAIAPKLKAQVGDETYREIRGIILDAVMRYPKEDVDDLIREAIPELKPAESDEDRKAAQVLGKKFAAKGNAKPANKNNGKPAEVVTFKTLSSVFDRMQSRQT